VRRQVGTRTLEAGQARVVTVSQTYDAPLDDVWDACTNPERLPRWFLPVSGDLRVGGQYQLEGNANGTVLSCDPPHGFTATWEFAGDVTWVELRLSPAGDGTRFELDHIAHVDDERWGEFGPGAVGIGWDLTLSGLSAHLSSGADNDAEQVTAWMVSDEGRGFMTRSGERWYEADVAGGGDPAAARPAADRTIAFYTDVPEEQPAP
jgi:uncharacterized protein YndB with AHSA1/START domain